MKITAPQLSNDLPVLSNLKQLIKRDETLSSAIISDEDISQLTVKSFAATELRLQKVNVTQARLERTSFSDVEFVNCALIASEFPDSSWRRVAVKGSRCSGLQLQTSTLKDVTFNDCKLNLANFRFSKLTNVCFKDCILDQADFYQSELKNVAFLNCVLDKAEFSASKLKQVDFRSSEITGILGIKSLAGAIIDSAQLMALAPILANELMIEVKDD